MHPQYCHYHHLFLQDDGCIASVSVYQESGNMSAVKNHKITLIKPQASGYGFSIRGGIEHKIGIYVSEVDVGSEAHLGGLQPGDQITKICGVPVHAATHKEAVALILKRQKLVLKVISGGVIPVKVRRSEPLCWAPVKQPPVEEVHGRPPSVIETHGRPASVNEAKLRPLVVSDTSDYPGTMKTNKSTDSDMECPEQKITISLSGHQGLGCSICKVGRQLV